MILLILSIAVAIAPLDASPIGNDGCAVSLRTDLSDPQPLVLVKKGLEVNYVNSVDSDGTLRFKANEEFRLACPGHGNYLMNVGNHDTQDIAAFCIRNKMFRINSVKYEFKNLKCKNSVSSVVRRTGKTCLGKYTKLEIGFELGGEFLRTIEVCRDEDMDRTVYAKFNLVKTIGGSQKGYKRPSWRQSQFWGPYKMDDQYKRAVQKRTVSKILGSSKLGDRYISQNTNYYLSRGHLAAKSDFVYGTAHSSTFWYVNTFPQWQVFNGGNWNALEDSVRDYASNEQRDLDVYTGTHGVMTLPDINNVQQPLYLYASGNVRALEVPLYFWKIIYDPVSKKGTAFVGVNNPYISEQTIKDYRICDEDISGQISYVNWDSNNISKGISYACKIQDLRKVVPTLPKLTVVDILK